MGQGSFKMLVYFVVATSIAISVNEVIAINNT